MPLVPKKIIIMKKLFLILLAALCLHAVNAQNYLTKSGHISFYSSTPVEDIEANNNSVTSILAAETGEMVFKVLMKSFQFEKALMQEHFNDNYVESDQFPEAKFKGQIEDFDKVDLSKDGEYKVTVTGDLTIHGVTQPVTADGMVTVKEGDISANSTFKLKPEDYDIKIPKAVRDNIAKVIEIKVDMDYDPM